MAKSQDSYRYQTDNTNLAYDISLFEPRVKEKPVPEKKPKIEARINTSIPIHSAAKIVLCGVIAFALFFFMISNEVKSEKLFEEIKGMNQKIAQLEADNAELAAQYEAKASLKKVEEFATDTLGLQKLDKSQIEYVEFEGNKVDRAIKTEKQSILTMIKDRFSDICEYLGL